jgi:serine/threonine-protein kinase
MTVMRGDVQGPDASPTVSSASARAEIARILASRIFQKAERLKRFLRFVSEEALGGSVAGIKESVIGVEVFDRNPATYDPRIDPIVRVEAGRLRAKLEDYYAHEGAEDAVVVELPRGQYVPRFSQRAVAASPAPGASSASEPATGPSNAIAVLPFANLSDDPANEYFSDGLTEELTHALARLPSVRVTARRSAFQFREPGRDIREIGRVLGAGKIVEGSVRKSENRLRISVQLVNVADGYQLWSEQYDRKMSDALALQQEIAGAVRDALLGRFGAGRGPPAGAPATNIEAFNHTLLGRFHWNKRNEAGLRAGIAHFAKAIEVDPAYGRAYAGLADCHVMLAMSGADRPSLSMPLAREAALRALEIDDRMVEAHTSLAVVRANFDWDRRGSELEFQRALECDPTYATVHHWYSLYALTAAGRFDEAEDEIEWAERLDPISLPINMGHAQVLHLADNCPAAIAQCEKVLGLDPRYYRAYWFLGLAHDRLGNFEAACEALETARAQGGNEQAFRARILGALGHAYGRWGKRDRATAVLDELAVLSRSSYVDPFEFAQVHAGLGNRDAALDQIERAVAERSGYLAFGAVWPAFEAVRSSPRFQKALETMSLKPAGTLA